MVNDKEVNYTAEQEAELAKMYLDGAIPAELAEKFGKSEKSIIAKLARMKIYKSKQVESPRLKKAEIVAEITNILALPVDTLKTFEKADKAALEALLKALTDDY